MLHTVVQCRQITIDWQRCILTVVAGCRYVRRSIPSAACNPPRLHDMHHTCCARWRRRRLFESELRPLQPRNSTEWTCWPHLVHNLMKCAHILSHLCCSRWRWPPPHCHGTHHERQPLNTHFTWLPPVVFGTAPRRWQEQPSSFCFHSCAAYVTLHCGSHAHRSVADSSQYISTITTLVRNFARIAGLTQRVNGSTRAPQPLGAAPSWAGAPTNQTHRRTATTLAHSHAFISRTPSGLHRKAVAISLGCHSLWLPLTVVATHCGCRSL